MLMIFQPPSQVGLVSSIVPESWRLRKISIHRYGFGPGRVTWEGQSESFPEHQGNLSHFKKDAEIRSGESGHKPGPRLPVCAREPGRLRASQQMATPVPCHPGPPHCHPVEAPHPSPPQATSVTVGLVVPSFWADNRGPIVPLAPLLSSRNTTAGAEACTPECTRYLPF